MTTGSYRSFETDTPGTGVSDGATARSERP